MEWKNIKRLGLGIVAFEGTEHLAGIITEIRDLVDYVTIGLQRVSYHNDPIDPIDLNEIHRLKEEGLVDEIVDIELDTSKPPRMQETDKRNLIIQDAEDHGCSHVIVIDSDEFYDHGEFLSALREIDEKDIEMSYCQYVNYYKDYMHYLVYPFKDGMWVPFVSKTKYRHEYECMDFLLPSDPSRRYVRPYDGVENVDGKLVKRYTVDYHLFQPDTVIMNHLSWLRSDIRKKMSMWSAKTAFDNYEDIIDRAVESYNSFDSKTMKDQIVTLLIKTPNNTITVKAFDHVRIHPKVDFKTRLRPLRRERTILILNMSSTNSPCGLFSALDKVSRETWAKRALNGEMQNVDYYTVVDTNDANRIDHVNKIIYIRNSDGLGNLECLFDRFIYAYNYLSSKKRYDYVLRVNTSTWCNLDAINEFLSYEEDDSKIYTYNLMSAFWSTFNVYLSGAMMLFSRRNMKIMTRLFTTLTSDNKKTASDDVLMSALWTGRANMLGLRDPYVDYVSFGGRYLKKLYADEDFSHINFDTMAYQVKTFVDERHETRLTNDVEKMKKLDAMWEATRSEKAINETISKCKKRMNTTLLLLKYSKKEWFAMPMEEKNKLKLGKTITYNKHARELLKELRKKNGYEK